MNTERLKQIRTYCAEPHTPLSAEAGWRATIAAIDALERIHDNPGKTTSIGATCELAIVIILTAWEGVEL